MYSEKTYQSISDRRVTLEKPNMRLLFGVLYWNVLGYINGANNTLRCFPRGNTVPVKDGDLINTLQ